MKCPQCQFDHPKNAKFCSECGNPLSGSYGSVVRSPSHTRDLAKIQRYLPQGLAEKILSQKDTLEGEHRQVTVMFVDMERFTQLAEKLGSEKVYHVMDSVYEILIREVNNFEGTVNEMTGDGIMALFGAPIALEDAPQRALRTALSIHRQLDTFNRHNPAIGPIRMRIGIHTGPVVVGTLGNDLRVDFKAVGNTVNLASRMEMLADAGSTLVTEATFKLTKRLFVFRSLGRRAVKGFKEAVAVYKLLMATDDIFRHRMGPERLIDADMVGRDHELEQMVRQVRALVDGTGAVVNVVGEAGVGKSRLVAELKKQETVQDVCLVEGRSISMGRNLSFHPIIDVLKQWAMIGEQDTETKALERLEAATSRLHAGKSREILPFVATLMGMDLTGRAAERIQGIEGEALEKLITKSVRELLALIAESTPLVVVMEDLHWADNSSIDLLASLFSLAETRRILFINLFRPDSIGAGGRIIAMLEERMPAHCVQIDIQPLDDRMSQKLIANILNIDDSQPAMTRPIVERSGGNPFFIEEILRSLVDEHAVVIRNGSFNLTDKIRALPIPDTINDVLMARIDRLEDKTRHLLKVASVIGRNFFYRILTEVADSIEEIDAKLSYLIDIQLIRQRRRLREIEYLFKHALAQEAAYASILPQNRREIHLKVADTIERIFKDKIHEFYGMLAYHYSRAENLEKAEQALINAGEEALKTSASSEALHYYQDALDLYKSKYANNADPEKVALLEKNIALALYNKGQCEDAVKYFDKALASYWGNYPKGSIAAGISFVSEFFHLLVGLYVPFFKFRKQPTPEDSEAIDLFFKKLKALALFDPKRFFFESLPFYKRVIQFDLTKFDLGIGLFVGASTLFSFSGLSFGLSRKILDVVQHRADRNEIKSFIIYDLAETMHNYMAGNWKDTREFDAGLVAENLDIGEIYWASHHLFWHGMPALYQGHADRARLFADQLIGLYENYGNEASLLLKQILMTCLLIEFRKLPEALEEVETGIAFAGKINSPIAMIHMLSCKARLCMLTEKMDKADELLTQTDKIRQAVNSIPWQLSSFLKGRAERELARLESAAPNTAGNSRASIRKQALESCRMLLKQSRKVAQHRTAAYRMNGVYFWLVDKRETALKWWLKSIAEGQTLGARIELSRTYAEVGKRLGQDTGRHNTLDGQTAGQYIEKARVLFEEMDLRYDLERLHRVVPV